MEWIMTYLSFDLEYLIRMVIAAICGGIIGYENMPTDMSTMPAMQITGLDAESTIAQRYDGSWLTSAQVLEMIESGKLVEYYNNQQVNFGDAAGPLKADEFVLVDLMTGAK